MNFGCLRPPLGGLEPEVRAVLAPSVAADPCESMDEVVASIEAGDAIAWIASDDQVRMVCVVSLHDTARGKQCFIRHCAGENMPSWLGFLDVIEAWACSQGCTTMELIGRAGWERVLGWNRQAVVLRKELAA